MPKWEFDERPPYLVEQEPTQRDQFNNDEVSLGEAVVRESIQNSTDAPATPGSTVKVRFAIREIPVADRASFRELLKALEPHLKECGLASDTEVPRVLLIEDFNTKGLTGDPGALDSENFHSFWRRHGKSGKSGSAAGRWGLGKLVYSSCSSIRAFFGLTIRANDPVPLLMGQCVLSNHEIGGKRYVAHGFWFADRTPELLQLPVRGDDEVKEYRRLFGVTRTSQPGLSLAIPYLNDNISSAEIIRAVIGHYYFPILTGRLVVEVDHTVIDASTFHEVAARAVGDDPNGTTEFKFVEQVAKQLRRAPDFHALDLIDAKPLGANSFKPEAVAEMKAAFSAGKLVHVRVGIRLRPKADQDQISSIDLFLQPVPEGAKAIGLFVRGSITVPAEARYYVGAHAMGALVASDEAIVAFLGDAENPAHTGWNGNAEKLVTKWRNAPKTLRAVRYSLRALHDILVEQVERKDQDALLDFFALTDAGAASKGRKRRVPAPPPIPPPAERAFRIVRPAPGAFGVVPGPGAAKLVYPKSIRVRVAYDILSGNPFKKHSGLDFDLDGKDIAVATKNMQIKHVSTNIVTLVAQSPDFSFEAKGFDLNRDLIVDAMART